MQRKDSLLLVSSGIFVGAALFDALPEAADSLGVGYAIIGMIVGAVVWWWQKNLLHLLGRPEMPVLVATALWFHSALEGIITGLSFGISRSFGYIVLTAMVLHLLPEFFATLALMRGTGSSNRSSALTALVGYAVLFLAFVITYLYLPQLGKVLPIAIALSGGAFLYIGLKVYLRRHSFSSALVFLIGVFVPLVQRLLFG